jgi:hypothetical protein
MPLSQSLAGWLGAESPKPYSDRNRKPSRHFSPPSSAKMAVRSLPFSTGKAWPATAALGPRVAPIAPVMERQGPLMLALAGPHAKNQLSVLPTHIRAPNSAVGNITPSQPSRRPCLAPRTPRASTSATSTSTTASPRSLIARMARNPRQGRYRRAGVAMWAANRAGALRPPHACADRTTHGELACPAPGVAPQPLLHYMDRSHLHRRQVDQARRCGRQRGHHLRQHWRMSTTPSSRSSTVPMAIKPSVRLPPPCWGHMWHPLRRGWSALATSCMR